MLFLWSNTELSASFTPVLSQDPSEIILIRWFKKLIILLGKNVLNV